MGKSLYHYIKVVEGECGVTVAFFLKAWGDWAPFEVASDPLSRKVLVSWQGEIRNEFCGFGRDMPEKGWHEMVRVGKKRAGRLLDGREHNELPTMAQP
jgi:protein gp37